MVAAADDSLLLPPRRRTGPDLAVGARTERARGRAAAPGRRRGADRPAQHPDHPRHPRRPAGLDRAADGSGRRRPGGGVRRRSPRILLARRAGRLRLPDVLRHRRTGRGADPRRPGLPARAGPAQVRHPGQRRRWRRRAGPSGAEEWTHEHPDHQHRRADDPGRGPPGPEGRGRGDRGRTDRLARAGGGRAGRRRRRRRRRPCPAAGLGRFAHPPDLRRRPDRRVRGPDGGGELQRRRDRRDHRRHPEHQRLRPHPARAWAGWPRPSRRAPPTSKPRPATAWTSRTRPAAPGSPPPWRTRSPTSAPTWCPPGWTPRSTRTWSAAPCSPPSGRSCAGPTSSASGAPSPRTSPGACSRPAGTPGWACGCTATSSARAPACGSPWNSAPRAWTT